MVDFSLMAAPLAAVIWAAGALIAHKPAKALGAFQFTRIQLITSAAILALIVTVLGGWATIPWGYWPAFVISGLFGVLLGNLAFFACLRRGGPRRAELLFTISAPASVALSYLFLSETMSTQALLGCLVTMAGIALAILFGNTSKTENVLETVTGSYATMIILGCLSGLCQAVGLIVLKPAMQAGADPLAVSALRLAVSAGVITMVGLWPTPLFASPEKPTLPIVLEAITPGILGYVIASSLLIFAVGHSNSGVAIVLGSTVPVMILPMIWIKTRITPTLSAWAGSLLVVIGTSILLT